MLITTGKVNNGVIQIDGKDLPEGTTVTLLAHEGDETFQLDPAQENELLAAIAEADRAHPLTTTRAADCGPTFRVPQKRCNPQC